METHSHSLLLPGYGPKQNHRLHLATSEGNHSPFLFDILLIEAHKQYCFFHVMETPRSGKCHKIFMSRNLGTYLWLKEYEFVQADKGLLFNINYMNFWSPAYEITLSHAHEAGLIVITPDFRRAFKEQLCAMGWLNLSIAPSKAKAQAPALA